MEIRFVTRNVEVPGDLKEYMERKLSKMEKFFHRIENSQIAVKMARNCRIVEVTANVGSVIMRGEEKDPDLRKAFDLALKNLERRVRRHKEYLIDRSHLKTPDFSFTDQAITEETAPGKIEKVKHFDLHPMSPEEAVMQMDLLEHSFFVFLDAESGKVNVVYKRDAGGYGLLIPK
ncbi:MAG: ribosome-associated translation inhibitor RaiA [Pyramidobacter sp.]|nr:ribosome-associated translation inhibitor RaiA [Pyramidobacter sp.]